MIWSYRGWIGTKQSLFYLAALVFIFYWACPAYADTVVQSVTDLPYGTPLTSSFTDYDPFDSRYEGTGSCTPPTVSEGLPGYKSTMPALSAFLSPYLNLSEYYTDNIYLAPAGFERSNLVTIVNPGIRGCTVGSLLRANFSTSAQGVAYRNNPPSNAFYLQQSGRFNYKVLPGRFYIDGNATYGQTTINPLQPNTTNVAFPVSNNRTNYFARTLSPYWEQSFGALGVGTLRYTYGRLNYGASAISKSTSEGKSFVLNSPSYDSSWSWVFHWSSHRVFYEGVSEQQHFDTVSTQLGYRINRTLQILGKIGEEDNYLPNGSTEIYGSKFWNAGFVWTRPYYEFKLLWGHRFFGTSFDGSLLVNGRNMQLEIHYNETPVSEALLVSNPRQKSPTASPLNVTTLPLNQAQYTNIFLSKRWAANFTYAFSRSQLKLTGYDEHDTYFTVPNNTYHQVGAIIGWDWTLTSRTSIEASLERTTIFNNGAQDFRENIATLGWNQILSRSSLIGFSFSHLRGEPIDKYADYTADSLDLYFHTIF